MMLETANHNETRETLKGKLYNIYHYLQEQQDTKNVNKVKQLAEKLEKWDYTIAFCGHFSAGKSTMINRVVGENILPSSPIPTSANLVKVRSGEDFAKVYFKKGKPRLYLAPYDYSLVKNYCKDGDQISEIEISYSNTTLPQNITIMDTPGIDSADDAHRIATESAIHLADLVFYVMDYNHVQAELNFLFTKELTEAGKEVYLIINQIDKHREEELLFSDFKASTLASFSAWGVKPAGIFYTSMKEDYHSHNQFSELRQFLDERIAGKDKYLVQSIFRSLKKITKDYLQQKRMDKELSLQPVHEILHHVSEGDRKKIPEDFLRAQTELDVAEKGIEKTKTTFDEEIEKILANAYMMPFETRALAEAYLEARQPEFKAGFLFAKQKTEVERSARLDRFYKDILTKTKAQIEWHFREYFIRFLKEQSIDHPELQKRLQNFSIDFPITLLEEAVKPGAGFSGTYVLQYSNDVADEIKRTARNQVSLLKTTIFDRLEAENRQKINLAIEKFQAAKHLFLAFQKLKDSESELQVEQERLTELLQKTDSSGTTAPLFEFEQEDVEVVKGGIAIDREYSASNKQKETVQEPTAVSAVEKSVNKLHSVVEGLGETAEMISELPGFRKTAKELAEKAARLGGKGFTVALFGAFSAGKSSFANALMGESVLPVSPNPTTAAINKIIPVSKQFPHGTVLVKFKKADSMLEDVNHSLKVFGLHAESLSKALKLAGEKLSLEKEMDGTKKTHYSFLQAFKRGCEVFEKQLGTIYRTTSSEFSEFVANEEKSCFVESIELYYDCELTRKGITLVDTPGADSINARHTGVAFDYIKNADAILFVTYYNHAFSKADREFIIQLGRVKESFQLDKMFFIINAIDLAEDEEEKQTVVHYVESRLRSYGIRNPHLFSLSSLQALQQKKVDSATDFSGMKQFEAAFYSFIENDLTGMAAAAGQAEVQRVFALLDKLLQSSKENEADKKRKRQQAESAKLKILEMISGQSVETTQKQLFQEAEELLYYIKQRVFLRFGDFFKESFNPAVLKEDGRNLKKTLQIALEELLESIGFDFAQEMRATTVRLDRFSEKILLEFQAQLARRIAEVNADVSYSAYEFMSKAQLDFESAFHQLDRRIFAKALAIFKNPRSFFEKDEKKWMSDEIYKCLDEPADHYLKFQLERMTAFYQSVLEKESARLLAEMKEQTEDFYMSLLTALDGGVSPAKLEEIQRNLAKYKV